MTILHPVSDFLFELFPAAKGKGTPALVEAVRGFYGASAEVSEANCKRTHFWVFAHPVDELLGSSQLEGIVDTNRVTAIIQHYYWMAGCFEASLDRSGERHLLN